ncbi:NADP-dependent oxidoreductase domain-containing protein [Lactarius hatsudake]|nr:NADP-dependent oxidoreductase domain-containing protein [Lactarius hatsudake]
MSVPTTPLNDGNQIPVIAFGTGSKLKFKARDVTAVVEQALEAGFSHIDTAAFYANEQFVGRALHESGLPRADVCVTGKYGGRDDDVQGAVRTTLSKLGLTHLDLYLVHDPSLIVNDDVEGLWGRMVEIRSAGLAKSIGVSNFTLELLQRVVKTGVLPAVNQIQLHPYNYASWKEVLEFSAKHGIVTEAYGSLAPITTYPGGPVDPVLSTIARRIGGTPGQRRTRLDEYLAVVHLPDLTKDEIDAIDRAGALGPPRSALVVRARELVRTERARRAALGAMVVLSVVLFLRPARVARVIVRALIACLGTCGILDDMYVFVVADCATLRSLLAPRPWPGVYEWPNRIQNYNVAVLSDLIGLPLLYI